VTVAVNISVAVIEVTSFGQFVVPSGPDRGKGNNKPCVVVPSSSVVVVCSSTSETTVVVAVSVAVTPTVTVASTDCVVVAVTVSVTVTVAWLPVTLNEVVVVTVSGATTTEDVAIRIVVYTVARTVWIAG
jgi:hypothetical protein